MDGLYLYCIRGENDSSSFSLKGIDNMNEVYVIPYKELEAIVSRISLDEFDSEEIKRKAQENLDWIKEKIVIHEKVVEEAMKRNGKVMSVIPMKFGTIFAGEKRLIETLDKQCEQFKTALNKLEGKEEWGVKMYLTGKGQIEETIKTESEIIKEIERKIAGLPEGIAYFHESELKEAISNEVVKKINYTKKNIYKELKLNAEDAIECKILEKEITGRLESMILNASYLIKKEMVEEFIQSAERKNKELNPQGFSLEYSGPWPPYYFGEQNV
ncbi:MAG: GvpL/GvpF family gas vesicle protein [Melioribacteraceae bacterium]